MPRKAVSRPHSSIVGLRSLVVLILLQPALADQRAAADAPPADPPPPRPDRLSSGDFASQRVTTWIGQLSHESYAIREAATAELLSAGLAARGQLLAVSRSPDPEVRSRARRLILLIDQVDFEKQLVAFANDVDGKLGFTLPGWDAYQTLVGHTPSDRQLFVELYRAERNLMEQVYATTPENAVQQLQVRLNNWRRTAIQRPTGNHAPRLGSCAAILLIGATSAARSPDATAKLVAEIALRGPIREAAKTGPHAPQIRRLLSGWILNCQSTRQDVITHRLGLSLSYELAETVPLAVGIALGRPPYGKQLPATRALAVLVVGKLGDARHVTELEPLLKDVSVCRQTSREIQGKTISIVVQLRDVVLATVVHLAGLDLVDFEMGKVQRKGQELFQLNTMGFADEEARAAALEKWSAWRKSNALELPGSEPLAPRE